MSIKYLNDFYMGGGNQETLVKEYKLPVIFKMNKF